MSNNLSTEEIPHIALNNVVKLGRCTCRLLVDKLADFSTFMPSGIIWS